MSLLTSARIMPFGDSITVGSNSVDVLDPANRVGYRYELWRLLKLGGYTFDFVGSQQTGPATFWDRDHEGHLARTIEELTDGWPEIVSGVGYWLPLNPPDVILLMAGTNDVVLEEVAGAVAAARLETLLEAIHGLVPDALVFVSDIPTTGSHPWEVERKAYAALIPGAVANRVAAGQFVRQLPTAETLPVVDIAGHLTTPGYELLARRWYEALIPYLERTPEMRTHLIGDVEDLVGDVDESVGSLFGTYALVQPEYHFVLGTRGLIQARGGYQRAAQKQLAAQLATGGLSSDNRINDQAVIIDGWQGGEGTLKHSAVNPSRYRRGVNVDIFSESGAVGLGPRIATAQSTAFNKITCMQVYKGNLFAGTSDGKVYRWTGSVWALSRDTTKSTGGITCMVVYNQTLYVANGQDGIVETYDGTTLTTTWTSPGFTVSTTLLGGGDTIVGVHSMTIHYLDGVPYLYFGARSAAGYSVLARSTSTTTEVGWRIQEPYIYVLKVLGTDLIAVTSNPTDRRFRVYVVNDDAAGSENLTYRSVYEGNWMVSGDVLNNVLYMGSGTGGEIWAWDGSDLSIYHRIGTQESPYTTPLNALMVYQNGLWIGITETGGTLALLRDNGSTDFSRPVSGLVGTTPESMGQFNGNLYLGTGATGAAKLYQTDGTFAAAGEVESALIDASLAGMGKLWRGVTIQHSALVSPQAVEVQYRLNDEGSWVSLGTSNTVGATSKDLEFGNDVNGNLIAFKILLSGTGGASTQLKVFSLAAAFVPSPGAKREWQVTVDLFGHRNWHHLRVDQTEEPLEGEELSDAIWELIDANVPVLFYDKDRSYPRLVRIVDYSDTDGQATGGPMPERHAMRDGWDFTGKLTLQEA